MGIDTNMTVLVVDDSGTMRIMIKKNLKSIGIENVILASDGADALNKMKDHKVDFILSDWNMPVMDGLEFLQTLRKDDKTKTIPFVMATAQGDKTQEKKAKDEGANGHIAKPFSPEQLKEKIEETLGLKETVKKVKREYQYVNGKVKIKVAHIQITDHLALGVLKHKIESGEYNPKYFELETQCIPGWNPIQKALEVNEIDAAFVLAPIAMDLFAFDVPIRLVSLAHKNGSIFVRSKNHDLDDYNSLKDLYKYKVIDIPHKMSIHNMLAHMFLSEMGLKPGVPGKGKAINVRFEVVPPIKMPQIMKEDFDVAGFIVAEPIGSNSIAKGISELEFLSTQLWDNHPCCIVAFQEEFIEKNTDAVFEFTKMLADAGDFIDAHKADAAEIAVPFLDPAGKLGLTASIINRVLNQPKGILMNDLYPKIEDFDRIQNYMFDEMGIGVKIDLEKFIDLRFAEEAYKK